MKARMRGDLRLLPLLSSATEIVHALGLGAFQVGRSHECDYPASVLELPVCTKPTIDVTGSSAEIDRQVKSRASSALSIYEVDGERLRALRPTHIITQTQCKVCAVSLEDVERALRNDFETSAQIVSLEPYALADVWQDIRRVARACGEERLGEELICRLRDQMAAVETDAKQDGRRPTVAALEWLDPLMAGGNWVPELIDMAGGRNLFGTAGQHSPWMTWEGLEAADPDVIVAIPCGFDLGRTQAEMRAVTCHRSWTNLRAVGEGRVFCCDGNQFMNRPGPRLLESLRIFAEILHPELFAPTLEGTGWERWTAG